MRVNHAHDDREGDLQSTQSGRLASWSAADVNTLARALLTGAPVTIYFVDNSGQVIYANPEYRRAFGLTPEQSVDDWAQGVHPADRVRHEGNWAEFCRQPRATTFEYRTLTPAGAVRYMVETTVPAPGGFGFVGTVTDVTELKEAEMRLATVGRLESIGRLAAGVAHEINTPIQFVSDSVYFIRECVQELLTYARQVQGVHDAASLPELNLAHLTDNLPSALDRTVEGLARVAEIVRSMKEFSHADQASMGPVDLNHAIQSTLVLVRGEYKDIAELATHFAELPAVTCHGGQINQVVLNLVVNAAHAIGDVVAGTDKRGQITVKTRVDGQEAVIEIGDTGGGIPEAIHDRIFDPFFSTKEVGRGTGQGLSIAHNIVVRGHGGSLSFETAPGTGTTFVVRLPIEQPGKASA